MEVSQLRIRRLTASDTKLVRELLAVFGDAFDDADTYMRAQPNQAYLERLLASDCFIALAAQQGDKVVGGVAAMSSKSSNRNAARYTSTIWLSM